MDIVAQDQYENHKSLLTTIYASIGTHRKIIMYNETNYLYCGMWISLFNILMFFFQCILKLLFTNKYYSGEEIKSL